MSKKFVLIIGGLVLIMLALVAGVVSAQESCADCHNDTTIITGPATAWDESSERRKISSRTTEIAREAEKSVMDKNNIVNNANPINMRRIHILSFRILMALPFYFFFI